MPTQILDSTVHVSELHCMPPRTLFPIYLAASDTRMSCEAPNPHSNLVVRPRPPIHLAQYRNTAPALDDALRLAIMKSLHTRSRLALLIDACVAYTLTVSLM